MVRVKGFIGGAYKLQSVNLACQSCINLYPQINESQNAPDGEIGALIGTPGLRLLGTCGAGPIRGIYTTSNNASMAVVSGSEVYRVNSNWTFSKVGDLLTSTGPVSVTDNGSQICIVDGIYGYLISMATGTFSRITSDGFVGSNTGSFLDGYFIFNNPGTGQFYWSNLYNGAVVDPLNFITAEGVPDNVVGIVVNQRQIWVGGQKTIEVFWNSGSDTTFSRIDGAFIEYGVAAPHTFKKLANNVIWLGYGESGQGVVWMNQGFQAKRVSNHGVEQAIQGYSGISSATAWTYQQDGHAFYVLNFPDAVTSWVFDISTGQWHERAYLGLDGNFERHRAECYTYGFGTHVVGDYANGNLYALDANTRSDNGRPLKWLRRSPHVTADQKRLFFGRAQLVARVGTGLDGAPANGTDPQVALRYSDDWGNTWSNEQSRSLGKIGQYATRVLWNRLGSSRQRVFEISGSDPVPISLLGLEVDVIQGAA